jgi:uroporphyrin-III C-methyltransferase/precorrin-2 dehydrogenase/sirohydrochlorin ferrochelatase
MTLTSLPLFHRVSGQRVVVVGEGATADAKRRLVERAGAACCGESEAHHARLAFIALDDPRTAEAAAMRLKSKGLLVNVADRPELCDFTLPSVLERGPVVIAVSTGGASAGLAKQLRLRLETSLPNNLGKLAEALHASRAKLRARWPDAGERRRALDAALLEGEVLDPLDGKSHERLEEWLADTAQGARTVTEEIQLSSDDPDDLSLRQARLLGTADAIVYGPEVAGAVLTRARADAIHNPEVPVSGLTVILRR